MRESYGLLASLARDPDLRERVNQQRVAGVTLGPASRLKQLYAHTVHRPAIHALETAPPGAMDVPKFMHDHREHWRVKQWPREPIN